MSALPFQEVSLLKPNGYKAIYPKLKGDTRVDVVVVGGGIAGLSAAYILKKAGQTVAVLEKNYIGSGTSGHTTGKVTSQHNIIYHQLVRLHGQKAARIYGQDNQNAIEQIEHIIKSEKIDCGWQRADNFVFTANTERVKEFKDEVKAAKRLGLPASFETKSDLPFDIAGAVRFADQAHFSGQKYVEGLAKSIEGNGSYVFEKTQATKFKDGQPCVVVANGYKITARNVIVATNVPTLPLLARATYCLFEYPHLSYLVAGEPKLKLKGMYISPDDDHYSILPVGNTLLVGGENHIPGIHRSKPRQQKLAEYAKLYFGVSKIDYRWHARDYIPYDKFPLVGKLYPWSRHMLVVSAFKKWGLSQSYVAATVLRDIILGQKNEAIKLYNPHRPSLIKSIPHTIAE